MTMINSKNIAGEWENMNRTKNIAGEWEKI